MTWIAHRITPLGLALLTACTVTQAADADTEGTGSSGSSGSGTVGGATSVGDGVDDADDSADDGANPTEPTKETDTMPDSGSESADTTDGCPVGTEGCLCDVGAACDDDLMCVEGDCVGRPGCLELDEGKHGGEDSATELEGEVCGGQSTDIKALGTIQGPEADWYVFAGDDGNICTPNPTASVASEEELTVCVFLDCNDGDATSVLCGGRSARTDSSRGKPGCCGPNAATVTNYDCSGIGFDNNVDVYISIASGEPICADYDVNYDL